MVIDNRAGATGTIGAALVAKSAPDGYTLLLGTSNELSMSPGLTNCRTTLAEDFAPLSIVIVFPNILVAHPSLPVKSVAQLVALARARARDNSTSRPQASQHEPSERGSVQVDFRIKIGYVPQRRWTCGDRFDGRSSMRCSPRSLRRHVRSKRKTEGLVVTDEKLAGGC